MTTLRIARYAGARRAEPKAITDLIHCPKHDNSAGASLKVDVALPLLERVQGSPARRASSVFIPEGAFDWARTHPRHLPFESKPAQTETTAELVVDKGRIDFEDLWPDGGAPNALHSPPFESDRVRVVLPTCE